MFSGSVIFTLSTLNNRHLTSALASVRLLSPAAVLTAIFLYDLGIVERKASETVAPAEGDEKGDGKTECSDRMRETNDSSERDDPQKL